MARYRAGMSTDREQYIRDLEAERDALAARVRELEQKIAATPTEALSAVAFYERHPQVT